MTEYEIKVAETKHKQELYDKILVESFYKDMPLFKACNVNTPPLIENWKGLQTIKDRLILIAVSPEDELLGVAINVIPNEGMPISGPKLLGQFWEHVLSDSKGLILELEQTTMELRILSVVEMSRGKGIAKRLVLESENLAKQRGYKSIFATSTGAFAERTFQQVGWKCRYTFMYEDYKKLNDDFILPPKPHDRFAVYEKQFVDG